MRCPNFEYPLDPLQRCTDCQGSGVHRSVPNAIPARTTLIETLSQEPSTSGAPGRVRAGVVHWLVAQATKLTHPDRQVAVALTRDGREQWVMLSLPECEAAIRQLMQAYVDAMGKGANFCAYPNTSGEQR